MCNVSYGIEKRGEKRGEKKGTEQALVKAIKNLMINLGMGIDQAMEAIGISENDYPKYRKLVEG